MSTRRAALGLAAAGLMGLAKLPAIAAGASAAASLPRPTSLARELERALGMRKALVVMVSLDGCPYCKLVRESYLAPLMASGQPVVQVELTGPLPLQDLRGQDSTHGQVVREWKVPVAPTVLFLGRGGIEAAARLSGVSNEDFYGAYLQERVVAANQSVIA